MLRQIRTFDKNAIAIDILDRFTEEDVQACQHLFLEKLNQGFKQVNVLVKLDEMNLTASSAKAFFEDSLFYLRHYNDLGHMAIVAHSGILKAMVPIDNLFFERAKSGRYERYFDVSQLEEAMAFVNPDGAGH